MREKIKVMREVTFAEYLSFIREHNFVVIGGVKFTLGNRYHVRILEPKDFRLEETTVWSFPKRGSWATHWLNARYRGNWAPQVVRNIILRYSREKDLVLDPFVGSGTTLIECKLLGRRCIGVDINYNALMLAWDRLKFSYDNFRKFGEESREECLDKIRLFHGNARNLDKIADSSVDLIATHPPYANIIRYSDDGCVEGNLSCVSSFDEYLKGMGWVAKEFFRVLKPNKYCGVLVGDTRVHRHYVPLTLGVLLEFLKAGFVLKEDIIKVQHNMLGTTAWMNRKRDFLLIAHEHLFVFRKPDPDEDLSLLEWSGIRWLRYGIFSSSHFLY